MWWGKEEMCEDNELSVRHDEEWMCWNKEMSARHDEEGMCGDKMSARQDEKGMWGDKKESPTSHDLGEEMNGWQWSSCCGNRGYGPIPSEEPVTRLLLVWCPQRQFRKWPRPPAKGRPRPT